MDKRVLIEIMATKPTKIYHAWLKSGRQKVERDQNKRVSKIIDKLNKEIRSKK